MIPVTAKPIDLPKTITNPCPSVTQFCITQGKLGAFCVATTLVSATSAILATVTDKASSRTEQGVSFAAYMVASSFALLAVSSCTGLVLNASRFVREQLQRGAREFEANALLLTPLPGEKTPIISEQPR